jgi:hypothetical protein
LKDHKKEKKKAIEGDETLTNSIKQNTQQSTGGKEVKNQEVPSREAKFGIFTF